MTMRIHRAVRTLSLLLALSMLLSVSAISSAAETPAPSVLTVSDSTLALVDRDQAFTATLTVDASVLGDASPDAWAAGLTWYLTREEGFQDGTLYPYYYPGDRLDRWQVWNNGEGGDALFTLGDVAASSSGGKVTVSGRLPGHERHRRDRPRLPPGQAGEGLHGRLPRALLP